MLQPTNQTCNCVSNLQISPNILKDMATRCVCVRACVRVCVRVCVVSTCVCVWSVHVCVWGGGVEVGYLPGNTVNTAAKADSCSFERVKHISVLKGSFPCLKLAT